MPLADNRFDKFDLHHMIIKPLYLGVILNIVFPGALLFLCYFLDNNNSYRTPLVSLDFTNKLFIICAVLTLVNAAVALYMRQKMFTTLLVMRKENLEEELTKILLVKIKPIFILIFIISLYGVGYYFLTTKFLEAAFFVVLSFLVFQVVRPRIGFIEKLIDAQMKLLDKA